MAFDHCHRLGWVLAQAASRQARKVGDVVLVQGLFQGGKSGGKQSSMSKGYLVGRRSITNSSINTFNGIHGWVVKVPQLGLCCSGTS